MPKFKDGAVVECTKGDTLIRGRLNTKEWPGQTCQYVGDCGDVYRYIRDGWTVTVVEEAPEPQPVYAPGVYLPYLYSWATEETPNVWLLRGSTWYELPNGDGYTTRVLEASRVEACAATMVRLEAPSIIARRVLERLAVRYGEDYIHNTESGWNDVAREFGVEG